MWICQKCGEEHDDVFELCWNCGKQKDGSKLENTTISDSEELEYYCTDCDAKVYYDDVVCPSCGVNLGENQTTTQPTDLVGSGVSEFFAFRAMISVTLVKYVYVLGIIVITMSGIVMILRATQVQQTAIEQFLAGIIVIVLGNLMWRLVCEGLIVIFSIHDILRSIEREVKK